MRNGLVEGVSLRAVLRESGAMAPEAAASVLAGMLVTLAVVHGDVCPEHVRVDGSGGLALTDFGGENAKFIPNIPTYLAPERLQGTPATPGADVFSATAVFFECLTNESPFVAKSHEDLRALHEYAEVIAEFATPELRPLAQHGLAPDPARRPASPHEFLDEVTSTATAAYGTDWQQRGRALLSGWAAAAAATEGVELAAPRGRGGAGAGAAGAGAGAGAGVVEAPPVGEPIDEALLGLELGLSAEDVAPAAEDVAPVAEEMPPPFGEPIDEALLLGTDETAAAEDAAPEPVAAENHEADEADYDWFTVTNKPNADDTGAEADVLAAFEDARAVRTAEPSATPYTPTGFDVFANRSVSAAPEAEAEPVTGHWDLGDDAEESEDLEDADEAEGGVSSLLAGFGALDAAADEESADEIERLDDIEELSGPEGLDESEGLGEIKEPGEPNPDAVAEPIADEVTESEAAAEQIADESGDGEPAPGQIADEAAERELADEPAERDLADEPAQGEVAAERLDGDPGESEPGAERIADEPAESEPAAEPIADELAESEPAAEPESAFDGSADLSEADSDFEFEVPIADSSELLAAFDAFAPSKSAEPEPEPDPITAPDPAAVIDPEVPAAASPDAAPAEDSLAEDSLAEGSESQLEESALAEPQPERDPLAGLGLGMLAAASLGKPTSPEAEAESEAEPESEPEAEPEPEIEAEPEAETEPEAEAELEAESEPEAEPEPEAAAEAEDPKPKPEPEPELEAEPDATAEPEPAAAAKTPDPTPAPELPSTPSDLEDDWVIPSKPSPRIPRSLSAYAVSLPSLPRPKSDAEADEPKPPVQTSAPDDWFRPGVAAPVGEDAKHTQVFNPDRENTVEREATRTLDQVPAELAAAGAVGAARADGSGADADADDDDGGPVGPAGGGGPRRKTLIGAVTTAVLLVAGATAVVLGGSGNAQQGSNGGPTQSSSAGSASSTAAPTTPVGTSDGSGGNSTSVQSAPSSHHSSSTPSRSRSSSSSAVSHSSDEAPTKSSTSQTPTANSSSSTAATSSGPTSSSSCVIDIPGITDCGSSSATHSAPSTSATSASTSGT